MAGGRDSRVRIDTILLVTHVHSGLQSPPSIGRDGPPQEKGTEMLKTDSELHIQNPRVTDKRDLHFGTVMETGPDTFTAMFKHVRFDLEPDQDIVIFYNLKRKFLQHSAKVVAVLDTEPALMIVLKTVGDPVSAEGREHYRVSTASAEIHARLESEENCTLVDISSTGFAVIAHADHALGTTASAAVHFKGETFEGTVCIQSVRDIGRGRIRYGMRYLEDDAAAGTLKTGLQKVSIAVERDLLKNQSGKS